MKGLGYILIAVGFLAGSVIAVQTEENRIDWVWFLPTLAVAAAGVAMARSAIAGRNRHGGAQQDNIGSLNSSIDTIVERIRQLDGEKADLDPYDVHGRIDEMFPAPLTEFVDARETIGHVFGLQAYAAVMNEFAAGGFRGQPAPELSQPGTRVYTQWWSRDGSDPFGSSLSDALHYAVGP